ncbi:hypothetical protein ACFO5O_05985 [Geojedonia litorea]|uniref:Adhesin domain-containing protein n=1 Tax=Geojedonia litorea TaxID=1268269 RepID=A0ABV9N2Y9_9FLAO
MNTKLLYKLILLLLLVPAITLASNWKGKHTKEKTIKKEYNVSANATLKVDNSYGNINVTTWNENRIVIEVKIKTNGNDEEKVQSKLNDIDVKFTATGQLVLAETVFSKGKGSSWWNWGKNNNVHMEINYIIKMPITNNVNLNNDYGSIDLDKLEGKATINCDYGKITTKSLMADGNLINFDYTNNSYFEYIKSGKINADYSGYTVGKAKNLQINADYTKSVIEIAEDVSYNCDYGSIHIEKANNVTGNGDYLTTRIGDIYKDVSIKADYGSIEIKQMTANAGNLKIDADYAGITVGFNSGYNFKFNVDLTHASLRDHESLEISKKNIQSSEKQYSGSYGNSNSSNQVLIKSSYGNVSLKKIN